MASASLAGFSMTGWTANSFRPQLPLPPIVYPRYFGKGFNFNYFLQSKFMALSFLFFGISFIIEFICMLLPFWFILHFTVAESTFGSKSLQQLSADVGIFNYYNGDYNSLLFLERVSNIQTVPGLFKVAQVMEAVSVAGIFCTLAGCGMLALRRYSSPTASLSVAAMATGAAAGQVIMLVFCILNLLVSANDACDSASNADCTYSLIWRNLPFKGPFNRRIVQHTTPKMEANWALYLACIGMVPTIAGCILLWTEALIIFRTVSSIRYQQLRSVRDVHEFDKHPDDYILTSKHRSAPGAIPVYSAAAAATDMYSRSTHKQEFNGPPSTFTESSGERGGSVFISREVDL